MGGRVEDGFRLNLKTWGLPRVRGEANGAKHVGYDRSPFNTKQVGVRYSENLLRIRPEMIDFELVCPGFGLSRISIRTPRLTASQYGFGDKLTNGAMLQQAPLGTNAMLL